jgi:NAD(P)H-nitrite reductase large subunit
MILGNDRAAGIQLADGEIHEGDLILIETRVQPNVELAFKAGIHVNKGIIVGDRLETSVSDIHAVGSAAEVHGVISGDPETVAQQARILGRYLAGDPTVRYRQTLGCNKFNILGLDIISFGEFNADDEESNILSYLDRGQLVYKKVVIRDNLVVGGLFFRDTSSVWEISELARKRADISTIRNSLLSGSIRGHMVSGKVVCTCVGVTREEIQRAIKEGAESIEVLQQSLGVGVTCGTCLEEVRELLRGNKE